MKYDIICYIIRYGIKWTDIDMIWYDTIWYDMIWYGMVYIHMHTYVYCMYIIYI